jgi:signal transduction histidine kinase
MIKSYASMIVEISGNNPEKRNKHAQVIIDEADRLASLVTDVLDLSKIRAGIETLEPKVFNLSAFVRQVLEKFEYLCESHGYSFEVDVEDGVLTRADEGKIGQVLYNLIGNAVNYTGDDKKVYVSLKTDENGAARFVVRDTGKGIKSEEIDTIWDRYYRSGETHKRPVQGTGLGLSIVKTVLGKHRFRFGVESEQGKGSTFFVLFPVWKRE